MIPAIRSEFRKLLTVRSTYMISVGFLLLLSFIDFYVHGYKDSITQHLVLTGSSPADHAHAAVFALNSISTTANLAALASAIIALLLLAHEYRYNTIMYTLTAVNRRSKVLVAKIIAILSCVFVYAVVATALSLVLVYAGAALAHNSLTHQDLHLLKFFIKMVFYSEAFAMTGLLFIALMRNQVAAIVTLLIFPSTFEGLLSLILKQHTVYLPFTALDQVVNPPVVGKLVVNATNYPQGYLTAEKGALVFLAYLVVAWIVAWILFLKRDAN